MIVTIEALEAWCPPTLRPVGLGRSRLAESTIAVASQSTRCSISRSAASCSVSWWAAVRLMSVDISQHLAGVEDPERVEDVLDAALQPVRRLPELRAQPRPLEQPDAVL